MLSQVSDSEKKSFIKINLGIRNDLQVFHKEFPRCYAFVQLMSYNIKIIMVRTKKRLTRCS